MGEMRDDSNKFGFASVIAIDKDGNFGKAFNTPTTVWATVKNGSLDSGLNEKCKIGESIEQNVQFNFQNYEQLHKYFKSKFNCSFRLSLFHLMHMQRHGGSKLN